MSILSKIMSTINNASIVTKFVFWSTLLLALTIYVVGSSGWNNQNNSTHDFNYWQDQYKVVASDIATDPEVKAATLGTADSVQQVTVLSFPFMESDGTNQQRVDRCESCHIGFENPSMTAEAIIKDLTKGAVDLKPGEVEAYLTDPEHKDILEEVKVLSCHPGKTAGLIKGSLPFAIATGSSPNDEDTAAQKQLSDVMDKHPFATYGCTTCHYGSGRDLQEVNAHGTENESNMTPLMPSKYLDATCAQCHTAHNSADGKATYLPSMTTIAKGQDLFKTNACWGCHKIEGYSKGNVGPELTQEGKIVRYETIEHQLWDPRYKVNNCVMPYFFSKQIITQVDSQGATHQYYLTNFGELRPLSEITRQPIDNPFITNSLAVHNYIPDAASEADVTALTTFILSNTGMNYAESQGNRITRVTNFNAATPPDVPRTADEGKLLFEASGCYACHYLGDPNNPINGKGGGVGPNLSFEGSRHSEQWMLEHYKNPQEFVPKSIMPVFPFSDAQRAALTLFDEQNIPTGAHPVSPSQDMSSITYPANHTVTNKTPDPQVRYMTR